MIEDGDIGYAGEYHESFRAKPFPRLTGPTHAGSQACRALLASLAARFKRPREKRKTNLMEPCI